MRQGLGDISLRDQSELDQQRVQVLAAVGLDSLRPLYTGLVELAATGQQTDDRLVDLGRAGGRPLKSIGRHLLMLMLFLMHAPDCWLGSSRGPGIASPSGTSDRRPRHQRTINGP